MGKSRAEIQRAYRERKKMKEGEVYKQNESRRVLKYYVQSEKLGVIERKKRNAVAAVRNKIHRRKMKQSRQEEVHEQDTSGYESQAATSTPLLVRLPCLNMLNRRKKRRSNVTHRLRKQIDQLESEKKNLQKRCKAKQKSIERLKLKVNLKEQPNTSLNETQLTPRSKTKQTISELNLTPKRASKIKRPLLFAHGYAAEIVDKDVTHKKKRKSIYLMESATKVALKYKCLSYLSKEVGIDRKVLERMAKEKRKLKRATAVQKLRDKVESFYEREDNCRTQPGKKDSTKLTDGKRQQTKVLTDYIENLHRKFCSENPDGKISLTSFARMRPRYVLTARFLGRQACMCIRHQNMALKMQAMRNIGVTVSSNPEESLDLNISEVMKQANANSDIKYKIWKRVTDDKNVKRMRVVDVVTSIKDFEQVVESEMQEFRAHVLRLRTQYKEILTLKEKLPKHEFLLQMDFAENYMCRSIDEVQSAYWHQTAVTLHPVVAYYRDDKLQHKSYVVISDELSHSAATVWTIIDTIIQELKFLDPDIQKIHFWTDSPTSQYRNKHIFHVVANSEQLYGVKSIWNYFEAGHGKGPCDGIGGTTKRLADAAVRNGSAIIQDAQEFYHWAVSSNMKQVTFIWLSKDSTQTKQDMVTKLQLPAVKGTMKLHAVCAIDALLYTRETSCYCDICLADDRCSTWKAHEHTACSKSGPIDTGKSPNKRSLDKSDEQLSNTTNVFEGDAVKIQPHNFVACVYEQRWYIGQVMAIDDEDVHVNFMKASRNLFKWPSPSDKLWVMKSDILCVVNSPEASAKSNRFFKLLQEDRDKVERDFESYDG